MAFIAGCIDMDTPIDQPITNRYGEGYEKGYEDAKLIFLNTGFDSGYNIGHTDGWNEMVDEYNKEINELTNNYNEDIKKRDNEWITFIENRDREWQYLCQDSCIQCYNTGWNDGTYKTVTDIADIVRIVGPIMLI